MIARIKNHTERIKDFFFYSLVYFLRLRKIKILEKGITIKKIKDNHLSVVRFGDGEFELIFGNNLKFQKNNQELQKKLIETLTSRRNDLLICINKAMFNEYKSSYRYYMDIIYRKLIARNINFYYRNIEINKPYGEASFSRFHMFCGENKEYKKKYIEKVKSIWSNRNVILVEGEKTRFGVGNDLLDNAMSVKRIIAPATDAFSKYNEILASCKEERNKNEDTLFIISLGPTATVLAYDLCDLGCQAIDIGHLDLEYMWFLNNAKTRINVPGKYNNESSTDVKFIETDPTHLEKYNNEIKVIIR
ncbi:GT-D fold domain-containing glycosyltransferase [Ornithobacterium rhinotracheale]